MYKNYQIRPYVVLKIFLAERPCTAVPVHYQHKYKVHTTSSLQKVITFYDYFSQKNYDFFMTSANFLCRGLMVQQ